jgi:(2Fe-2S) ferredoxin
VECLGACVNAPILQVNDDFYEDLDYQSTSRLLDSLEAGDPLPVGSVVGRCASEPSGGATSLTAIKGSGGKAKAAKTASTKKRGKAHA